MRRLILLIGPTCSGKSTLEQELNRRGIPSVVSYTTRTPRTGEINGVHYEFLTKESIDLLEKAGRVVQKVYFAGNYYGSTTGALDHAFAESGTAVIVVEPTGLTQFLDYAQRTGAFQIVSVYINGPYDRLVTRLINRATSDANADAAHYWQRLVQQREAYLHWPTYTDSWSIVIDEVDDDVPNKSVQAAADLILGTLFR